MMLALSVFLGDGIFHTPFGFVAAIANFIAHAVLRRRQGVDHIMSQLFNAQTNTSVAPLEEPCQAPCRETFGTPRGQFCQGFTARIERLQDNEPIQQEAMLAVPNSGHALKNRADEGWQVSQDGHRLRPNEGYKMEDDRTRWNRLIVMPSFTTDLQGLQGLGCRV
jgi:hypothetical protein